jgi:hypothetical protein
MLGRDPVTLKIFTESYLSGGRVFRAPPPINPALHEARVISANLTGENYGFFSEDGSTFERFQTNIVTGTHADESPPRPIAFPMPWPTYRNLLDEDLRAIYVYLSRTPTRSGAADKQIQDFTRWCATAADCRAGETCSMNPATTTNECVGGACSTDHDCSACQVCTDGACMAPTVSSVCLQQGL